MKKRALISIIIFSIILSLSGCSSAQNNGSPSSTIAAKTIDQLTSTIDKLAARYGDPNPEIVRAGKDITDGPTHDPMYGVVLKGNFTKGSLKASNLSFSILADGSQIWAIRAYDDNNNDIWLDNDYPNSSPQESHTSLATAPSVTSNSGQSESTETTNVPTNIVTSKVPEAEQVPRSFYQALSNKNYDSAKKLLGPELETTGEPSLRKYWENIEQANIISVKDISASLPNLDNSETTCFSVKIYYVVLDITVKDKNLVPGLDGRNYRRMDVVKVTKDGPWVLNVDATTPPQ